MALKHYLLIFIIITDYEYDKYMRLCLDSSVENGQTKIIKRRGIVLFLD